MPPRAARDRDVAGSTDPCSNPLTAGDAAGIQGLAPAAESAAQAGAPAPAGSAPRTFAEAVSPPAGVVRLAAGPPGDGAPGVRATPRSCGTESDSVAALSVLVKQMGRNFELAVGELRGFGARLL